MEEAKTRKKEESEEKRESGPGMGRKRRHASWK